MVYGYSLTAGRFDLYDAGSMEEIDLFSANIFTEEEYDEKVAVAIRKLKERGMIEQDDPYPRLRDISKILVESGEFFEIEFIRNSHVHD